MLRGIQKSKRLQSKLGPHCINGMLLKDMGYRSREGNRISQKMRFPVEGLERLKSQEGG
jgi:hypothetical protein